MSIVDDIALTADALTDPHQSREPIYGWSPQRNRIIAGHHTITLPGLLQRLHDLTTPGSAPDDNTGTHGVPGSRPPLNLDACSAYTQITVAVVKWCWDQRIDLRNTTESNIRALVGAAGAMSHDTQCDLVNDLRSWRHQCEVLLGDKTRAHLIPAPCPNCDTKGTLRARGDRAWCLHCEATWDDTTAGILAEHVRGYRAAAEASATAARLRARGVTDRSAA